MGQYKYIDRKKTASSDGTFVFDFSILTPKRYWYLSSDDVNKINDNYIKEEEPFFLKKNKRKIVLVGFDFSKKKIDEGKILETFARKFTTVLSKFKEGEAENAENID